MFDRSVERPVPGYDAQAIRFENDDGLTLADAGGETLDPRKISRAVRRTAGRIERTVPERNVVRNKNRNLPRSRSTIDDVANLGFHQVGRPTGEP